MRTNFEFDFVTTATPDQVIELMTDFSPNRPHRWPASSEAAFEVYHVGETDAEIREGQDFPKLWSQSGTSSKNLAGLIGMATMRFIGPRFLSSYYKKVYDGHTPPRVR